MPPELEGVAVLPWFLVLKFAGLGDSQLMFIPVP